MHRGDIGAVGTIGRYTAATTAPNPKPYFVATLQKQDVFRNPTYCKRRQI